MKYKILLCIQALVSVVQGQSNARITELTEPVVANVGSSATLNCTVSDPGDTKDETLVEWVFLNATDGGKSVSSDCRITEEHNIIAGKQKYKIACQDLQNSDTRYALTINALSAPDNGIYQCRVRLSNVPDPIHSMNVPLQVLSPPRIQFAASDIKVDAYIMSNVTMKCQAEGSPAPNITWGRANGRPLPEGRSISTQISRTSTITTQHLHIMNLTKEDKGTYRCSADNNIRPPDDLFALLSIEFKPSVAPVEPSYGAATGENTRAMMWCKVEGNPRPTMRWYAMSKEQSILFRDGRLEIDDRFYPNAKTILTDEKYLVEQKIMTVGSQSTMESMFYSLSVLTVEPNDLVYYVCQASNTHGSDATAIELYGINALNEIRSSGSHISLSMLLTVTAFILSYVVTF